LRTLIRSLPVLALTLGAYAGAQDLTIVSKVTRDGGPPETATSYLSADHVRMSHGSGKEFIIDLKAGQMASLDGKAKTYFVITLKDLDDFAAKMQERMNSPEMKKARESLKELPPEDRKRLEAAMDMNVDVHKSGSSRRIAGYACENWTVNIGQLSRSEQCVTADLQFPMQAWEMYRHFSETMQSLMSTMGPAAANTSRMVEQFKKMKGYPLANTTTVEIMGNRSVTVSEVVEIKKSAIPASAWDIPADYTKVDNPMLKALEPRKKK
jgi:uncharacterized protein DUF4412